MDIWDGKLPSRRSWRSTAAGAAGTARRQVQQAQQEQQEQQEHRKVCLLACWHESRDVVHTLKAPQLPFARRPLQGAGISGM